GRVAATDASVLITGESGTGKELVAEAVHRNSRRTNAPFVKVNLGGISSSLFESEMFGHVRGAFTDARADRKGRFELADGGTHFLHPRARMYRRERVTIAPAAHRWLQAQPWPGNVRQLRQTVERAVLVSSRDVLDVADFREPPAGAPPLDLSDSLPAVGSMT